ncbi:DMT family transporter [uncultured Sneathiella sp.]|jgi:drug/metabolite transporter (DMT)-like permease|uniref:DMT family transporter n=1 Tax=uncultured Sneathiella sp. TaxID=879315 RepID=UPI0030D91A42|tara:strand:+ start:10716 stop:11630 length:915 start_codon:yes stop_codon:yes gene_type:complete
MPLPAALQNSKTLQGIAWMVLSSILFVGMTGIIRHLGSGLPAVEAAFIRYFLGSLMILPMVIRHWPGRLSKRETGFYTLRGIVHAGGVILWFYAMARIPIAEVTAIGYVAPIFVTIGAALFLGERLQFRRIGGVICGFIGALIILRPGFQEINLGQMAQLCAAPLFAISFILAKKLTETQDSSVIVGMLTIACTIALLPGAIFQWRNPTLEELLWLTLAAVIATAAHYTLTRAFQAAPITVTQPLGFLQLIWAAILGVLAFGEPLDPYVMIGGAVIIGAATYISHRELQVSRQQQTPTAIATKV